MPSLQPDSIPKAAQQHHKQAAALQAFAMHPLPDGQEQLFLGLPGSAWIGAQPTYAEPHIACRSEPACVSGWLL